MDANEIDFMDRLLGGDASAFRELVETYKKKIYFIIYDIVGDHHEAEDISQEVFIKVYRSLETFRREAKMSSWIYQIAVNASIDHLRRKKPGFRIDLEDLDRIHFDDELSTPKSAESDPERQAITALLQQRIQQAHHNTPPRERTVFVMRHYNEFKIQEIADILAFVLSFANAAGIDISTALRAKMAKNAQKYPADEYRGRY